MPVIKLILDGNGAFSDLKDRGDEVTHLTEPFTVAALARGMKSGHPSLAIRIDLPDGKVIIQKTSVAAWLTVSRALEGKFGRKLNKHGSQETAKDKEVKDGTRREDKNTEKPRHKKPD